MCIKCEEVDGNGIAIYRHLLEKNRERPANILCYYQPTSQEPLQLIGFLGAFFFHDKACELALMVAPAFRRQGIASNMLKLMMPLFKIENIEQLIFSSPHQINDNWLSSVKFHYNNSEFHMQHSGENTRLSTLSSVVVRLASPIDIPSMCDIDKACFPHLNITHPSRLQRLLQDKNVTLLVIQQHGQIIGKAQLNWEHHKIRISDVAILPAVQKRGLGSILITHCIHYAHLSHVSTIVLDVETTNKQALNLYSHLGFTVINAHDYWSIDEFGLTGFLEHT